MNTKTEIERQEKILDWLIGEKFYDKSDEAGESSDHIALKGRFGSFFLLFKPATVGFSPYEYDEKTNTFVVRKGIRDFKNYFDGFEYRSKRDLKYLEDNGWEEFVKWKAKEAFVDEADQKVFSEIELTEISYSDREELVEKAITGGKTFYEWRDEQEKLGKNWREISDINDDFKRRKKKIESLFKYVNEVPMTLKWNQSNSIVDYLNNTENEKNYRNLLNEGKSKVEIKEMIMNELYKKINITEYTEKEVDEWVGKFVDGWIQENEADRIWKEKSEWSSEQWKSYKPSESGLVGLREWSDKKARDYFYYKDIKNYSDKEATKFVKEIKNKMAKHESFVYLCQFCKEAGKTTFELKFVVPKSGEVIYTCSRCENTSFWLNSYGREE